MLKYKYCLPIEQLFLDVLSAALWSKPLQAASFTSLSLADWKALVAMAHKQSVNALVADQVLSLPAEALPPQEVKMQLLAHIEQTKSLNHRRLEVLAALKEEYNQAGFPFVLMKGPASGHYYPNPMLRNPGDIDILLYGKGDYERSLSWALKKGYNAKDAGHIHYNYDWNGVVVEPHRRISYFDRSSYDRMFIEWEKEVMGDGFPVLELDASGEQGTVDVWALPVEMNAFFLFHHTFRHFIHQGVGLRQLCDWVLFLQHHYKQIDPDAFTERVCSYKLLYPMQVFASVAVQYLEAPPAVFPFVIGAAKEHHVRAVAADILRVGNFGFHKPGKKRPDGKYSGMWYSYVETVKRTFRFASLSCSHIAVLPHKKLINRLRIGFDA